MSRSDTTGSILNWISETFQYPDVKAWVKLNRRRIYVELEARSRMLCRRVLFDTGGDSPSHDHMTGTTPDVFFLHYLGRGPALKLAAAVRVAVDQTARPTR